MGPGENALAAAIVRTEESGRYPSDHYPVTAVVDIHGCSNAGRFYLDTKGAALLGGPALCLDRVTGGYCTHACTADADCCAAPGECKTSYPEVCAPFESAAVKYCFLSCEDGALGGLDANAFCMSYPQAGFTCRSTGGASQNRKMCMP